MSTRKDFDPVFAQKIRGLTSPNLCHERSRNYQKVRKDNRSFNLAEIYIVRKAEMMWIPVFFN